MNQALTLSIVEAARRLGVGRTTMYALISMQNLRRGHYELGTEALPGLTVPAAFDELASAI